jgi:hypothetical protein
MNKNTGRLLLIAAAILLVSLALQGRTEAFTLPCPSGYSGSEIYPFGCCGALQKQSSAKLSYYVYTCFDGERVGSATLVCSTEPCDL